MRIRPGEKVRLVGPNGAGKTTLLNVLAGLYTPDGGQVAVFDRSPQMARRDQLISYVQQVTPRFDLTLADNLDIRGGTHSREQLSEVQLIAGLPDIPMHTVLGPAYAESDVW